MNINIISNKEKNYLINNIDKSKKLFNFFINISPPVYITDFNKNRFDWKLANLFYGRKFHNGEAGCSLAHTDLIRSLNFDNSDWNIILEDDAQLEEDFFIFLETVKSTKILAPTIILLGHSRTIKNNLKWQRLKHPLRNIIKIGKYSFGQNKWVNACGVGTVGYIINSKAKNVIVDLPKNFWLADDWKIFNNSGISIYHPILPLIWEDFTTKESTTGNPINIHHNFFSRKILREIAEVIYSRLRVIFYKDFT